MAIFQGVGTVEAGVQTAPACRGAAGVAGCSVTVDNGQGAVNVAGMQFAVDGYTISGGTLTLVADAVGLQKDGLGTLVLGGSNTYSGATAIDGGALQVSSNVNPGLAAPARGGQEPAGKPV